MLFDLDLHGINHSIARDHLGSLGAVPLQQRLDRLTQRRFGFPRHREEPHLDLAQLVMEVAVDVSAHPNLPVMYASVRW